MKQQRNSKSQKGKKKHIKITTERNEDILTETKTQERKKKT